MKRVPEPELMDSAKQARAYAEADFSDANSLFTREFIGRFSDLGPRGRLADLGCGPADICVRIAGELPGWTVTGIDAGPNMLKHARTAVSEAGLDQRITLKLSHLPDPDLGGQSFSAVISNSLLHHLPEPSVLWSSIRQVAAPGAAIQVMDLARPESTRQARDMVERHAAEAPQVLKDDFYNSLLAAYTPEEVEQQLRETGLAGLDLSLPSDRHWMISGRLPA